MEDAKEHTVIVDFGYVNVATAILFVLKLSGKITWSWWVVWSPVLVYGGLTVVLLAVIGVVNAVKK